jgi:hypothetical protein
MSDNQTSDNLKICIPRTSYDTTKKLNSLSRQNSLNRATKLKAAFLTSKKWTPGDTIRIKFLEIPSPNLERTSLNSIKNVKDSSGNALQYDKLQETVDNLDIISAIKLIVKERIQPFIGLTFMFVDSSQNADIRISFNGSDGAWSLIGTDCRQVQIYGNNIQNEATMNFGWFDVATVMHEFGHALGMIHEHQNPSGNQIQWNTKAVYDWARRTQGWDQQTAYQQIIEPYEKNSVNGSNFDPLSIMLYFFPGSLTLNNKGTHENLRLSGTDVIYLAKQYPISSVKSCGQNTCLTPDQFYMKVYGTSISSIIPTLPPTLPPTLLPTLPPAMTTSPPVMMTMSPPEMTASPPVTMTESPPEITDLNLTYTIPPVINVSSSNNNSIISNLFSNQNIILLILLISAIVIFIIVRS